MNLPGMQNYGQNYEYPQNPAMEGYNPSHADDSLNVNEYTDYERNSLPKSSSEQSQWLESSTAVKTASFKCKPSFCIMYAPICHGSQYTFDVFSNVRWGDFGSPDKIDIPFI
jgi:hypothetical protein